MPDGVRLWVPGRPRTKGSLKPVHIRSGAGKCRVSLTESGGESEAWKKIMITVIRGSVECARYPHPVKVDTEFVFAPETQADIDGIAGRSRPWPAQNRYGDEDKLRRNVLDALTQSALIFDDALVIGGTTLKRWARDGEQGGVWIEVRPA
jgi:Holliday junction resolvase RusA-like endonuclease